MELSGYRTMWLLAMFDLPVTTEEFRRNYTVFRKFLLDDGFRMLQFSVYSRHCSSEENAAVHAQRVRCRVPPEGEVRLLIVTDRQFERMRVFCGKTERNPEKPPAQLTLF